eukprot:TRINITY_DN42797_c0_g1_i1.p1 TRINITY_DN42797_c0_g1~~TRINITY_DN42797_c0_g1_i1.p1  ORF type:complete len:278 (+),score=73.69 TRINITY_DN42797_c0_g1_i1:194-1027(+)
MAIYKSLIFSFVEMYQNASIRKFMEDNFIELFKSNENISIQVLIEPTLKQMRILEPKDQFNLSDFEFFYWISKYRKLDKTSILQMLEILSQVVLNDLLFSSSAVSSIISLVNNEKISEEEPEIYEFIKKFVKLILGKIVSKSKSETTVKGRKNPNELANIAFSKLMVYVLLDFQNQDIAGKFIEEQAQIAFPKIKSSSLGALFSKILELKEDPEQKKEAQQQLVSYEGPTSVPEETKKEKHVKKPIVNPSNEKALLEIEKIKKIREQKELKLSLIHI